MKRVARTANLVLRPLAASGATSTGGGGTSCWACAAPAAPYSSTADRTARTCFNAIMNDKTDMAGGAWRWAARRRDTRILHPNGGARRLFAAAGTGVRPCTGLRLTDAAAG